ncbi:MAG: serine hydrolase [Clostridia bacterium]|nr:serine hydrolase [Clostridia bacterium]
MLKNVIPEKVGIRAKEVHKFLYSFEKRKLHLHSLILMKGEDIFLESYWAPFTKETPHRMYSVTKSFVSVAVGLAEEDGLLDINRPIIEYFPEKIEGEVCEALKKQTVRDMLTMTTVGPCTSWFKAGDPDRTHLYFKDRAQCRTPGTVWQYDSSGSQVICNLVEKVTGKSLFDYLNERIFVHLDAFKNAKMLKTPNGVTWGDSAMICTPRDLAIFARFVMNYGTYDGKRLMNEEYLRMATSCVVSNLRSGHNSMFEHGYGYQFWRTENNGFAFVGMGNQLAICLPDKDLIMVCTGDMQGNQFARDYIAAQLMDIIYDNMCDAAIAVDTDTNQEPLICSFPLFSAKGMADSPFRSELDGITYKCIENPLGWQDFCFEFEDGSGGKLIYTKSGRKKELPFYVNKNRFGIFPEEGYSKEYGGMRTTDGHKYKDAVSFAWLEEKRIQIFVQIIDDYFGNLALFFGFRDDKATVTAVKAAENFLWDYAGEAIAEKVNGEG